MTTEIDTSTRRRRGLHWRDRRYRVPAWLLVYALGLQLLQQAPQWQAVWRNAAVLIASAAAAWSVRRIFALSVLRRRAAWGCLWAGSVAWVVGQFARLLAFVPGASAEHATYAAGLLLIAAALAFAVGMFFYPDTPPRGQGIRRRQAALMGMLLTAFAVCTIEIAVGPLTHAAPQLSVVFGLAYTVVYIVALFAVVTVFWVNDLQSSKHVFGFMAAAIFSSLAAAPLGLQSGGINESLWVLAGAFLLLAAESEARLGGRSRRGSRRRRTRVLTFFNHVVPGLATVAMLLVLSVGGANAYSQLETLIELPFIVLFALCVVLFQWWSHLTERDLDAAVHARTRELERGEARFRNFLDITPVGVCQVSSGCQLMFANPALAHMLLFDSSEELTTAIVTGSIPGVLVETIEKGCLIPRFIESGDEQIEQQLAARRKDGSSFHAQAYLCRRHDPATGEDAAYCFVVDITEQHLAEEAIEKHLAFVTFVAELSTQLSNMPGSAVDRSIPDSLARLAAFVGVDRAALISLDPAAQKTKILYRYAAKGYEEGAREYGFDQLPWYVNELMAQRTVSVTSRAQWPALAPAEDAAARSMGMRAHLAVPFLSMTNRYFVLAISDFQDRDEWPDYLIHGLRLIGELFASAMIHREQDEQATDLQNDLSHVSRVNTLGELAASLAHEINQPLAGCQSNASAAIRFLKQSPPDLEEIGESLVDIVEDSKRAGDVIKRMRALLKKGVPELSDVDVNLLIEDVFTLLHSQFVGKGVQIDVELGDDLPLVRGDGIQLQQVVLNLLVNGAQAMWTNRPDQPRRLRVRTRLLPDEDRVVVSVSDHGPGVDGPLEKLFEPFFSTKKEGLGMGLAINRTLIEAHGGRLTASRNPERGLTFTFSLPVSGPHGAGV